MVLMIFHALPSTRKFNFNYNTCRTNIANVFVHGTQVISMLSFIKFNTGVPYSLKIRSCSEIERYGLMEIYKLTLPRVRYITKHANNEKYEEETEEQLDDCSTNRL